MFMMRDHSPQYLFRILQRFSPEVRTKLKNKGFHDGKTLWTKQCPLGYALNESGMRDFDQKFKSPSGQSIGIALYRNNQERYLQELIDEAMDFIMNYLDQDWKVTL